MQFCGDSVRRIPEKLAHTNHYLKYKSHNPTSAKQSVITALLDRTDSIISSEKDKKGKHHILAALQQNGYPKEFIQRTVKSTTKEKNSQESAQKKNLSKQKVSTYLTFEESVSSLTLNRPGGGGGAESAHRLVLPSAVLKR